LKIVICDDNRDCIEKTSTAVKNILYEKNITPQIDIYLDSREVYSCGNSYDIAFLDVNMEYFSGIEIAKQLKSINPYIIIFIITSYDQYLDDAMDLNVFRYIRKPTDEKRLKSGLLKALEYIDNCKISFYLKQGEEIKNIVSNDIVYIETVGRATKVVTVNGEYLSSNKMDFWKTKLISSFFYSVHKSYIINMKYISDYKRDTVGLLNKYSIPIAYRKQADFRGYFFDHFGGSI